MKQILESAELLEGELLLYRTANDAVRIEVLHESDTFWLNQKRIAELFGVEVPTISYHLKEIYASGELTSEATVRRILRVQQEGAREVRREIGGKFRCGWPIGWRDWTHF